MDVIRAGRFLRMGNVRVRLVRKLPRESMVWTSRAGPSGRSYDYLSTKLGC